MSTRTTTDQTRSMMQPANSITIINVRDLLATFILVALVFFSPPLFFIERYSLTSINKPVIFALILALAMLFLHRNTISTAVAQLSFLQLIQACALLALPFAHMSFGYDLDMGYFSAAFQIFAGLALFFVLANANRVNQFVQFWVNTHLIIGACGLLVFIGGLALNIAPVDTFLDRPYYDFGLAYTNVFYQIGNIKLIRVAGFYDEPGTFAFYMTISLLLARMFALPRWKEFALIVFGLSSLSMAYIVVILIWIALGLSRRNFILLVFIIGAAVITIGRVDSNLRDVAYDVTVGRFSISESQDRVLKGDNRTAIMKQNFRAFLQAPVIGHGTRHEDYVGDIYGASFIANPIAPLARHGILGAFFMNIHVLVLFVMLFISKRIKKRQKLLALLVLSATLAQRPTTINGVGYVLFIMMIYRLTGDYSSGTKAGA